MIKRSAAKQRSKSTIIIVIRNQEIGLKFVWTTRNHAEGGRKSMLLGSERLKVFLFRRFYAANADVWSVVELWLS
jgi:hypothetical protein